MKPGAPKRDPAKTAAWRDASRRPLARRAGPSRAPRKPRARIPQRVRDEAYGRSRGLCICGCGRKAVHLHHVYGVALWPELATEADNLVGVAFDCHMAHENASRRLPRARLPDCALKLADKIGGRAFYYLERTYA